MYKKIIISIVVIFTLTIVYRFRCDIFNCKNPEPSDKFLNELGFNPFYSSAYEPGSLITTSNFVINDAIPRFWLNNNILDTLVIATGSGFYSKSSYKHSFRDEFVSNLKIFLDSSANSNIGFNANDLKDVIFQADSFEIIKLKNGSMAMTELLKSLTCDGMQEMATNIQTKSQFLFITSILKVKSGKLSYIFNKGVSDSTKLFVQNKLNAALNFSQTAKWNKDDTIEITYNNSIVGFLADTIKTKSIDDILKNNLKDCDSNYLGLYNESFTSSTNFWHTKEEPDVEQCFGDCSSVTKPITFGQTNFNANIGGCGSSDLKVLSNSSASKNKFFQEISTTEVVTLLGGINEEGRIWKGMTRVYAADISLPKSKAKWNIDCIIDVGAGGMGNNGDSAFIEIAGNGFTIVKKYKRIEGKSELFTFSNIKPGIYKFKHNYGPFNWGNIGTPGNKTQNYKTDVRINLF